MPEELELKVLVLIFQHNNCMHMKSLAALAASCRLLLAAACKLQGTMSRHDLLREVLQAVDKEVDTPRVALAKEAIFRNSGIYFKNEQLFR